MKDLTATIEKIRSILDFPILKTDLLNIELGNLLLGLVVFFTAAKLIPTLVRRLMSFGLFSKIRDQETNQWLRRFTSFIFMVILTVSSLTIIGFPFRLFGSFWHFTLFTVQDNTIELGNILMGLILLYPGIRFSRYLSTEFKTLFLKRLRIDAGTRNTLEALSRYLMVFIVVLFVLTIVGIPLTAFTILGGALAIGVGLGSQNLVNNFLSGLVLMTEKPLKVNDIVELENRRGIVEHIGGRSTRIKTFDNVRMVIPNSKLLENTVINWSLIDNYLRREISVGVSYGSPATKVGELLRQVVANHNQVEKKPEPVILFDKFGDDALIFKILFWVQINDTINPFVIESDIRYGIYDILEKEQITIAYPQRDVHLDSVKPIEVSVIKSDKK
ncbi:MAG: mechanosensitive ion channel [Candidatus Marinimicrobia bacterium]|nr:mechanosensitive ion channel [Candidatus Neomarinimicrobiota bacterium]